MLTDSGIDFLHRCARHMVTLHSTIYKTFNFMLGSLVLLESMRYDKVRCPKMKACHLDPLIVLSRNGVAHILYASLTVLFFTGQHINILTACLREIEDVTLDRGQEPRGMTSDWQSAGVQGLLGEISRQR